MDSDIDIQISQLRQEKERMEYELKTRSEQIGQQIALGGGFELMTELQKIESNLSPRIKSAQKEIYRLAICKSLRQCIRQGSPQSGHPDFLFQFQSLYESQVSSYAESLSHPIAGLLWGDIDGPPCRTNGTSG